MNSRHTLTLIQLLCALAVGSLLLTSGCLAAPGRGRGGDRLPPPDNQPGGQRTYDLSETLSQGAQLHTIAFSGFAFLTGNLGAASFFPPGKVADWWGFQYLRDNDPSQFGHGLTPFQSGSSRHILT